MRIPDWTPALKPQPQELVDAILKRGGGALSNWTKPCSGASRSRAAGTDYLVQIRDKFFESERLANWLEAMLDELATSGALVRKGNLILNA